MEIWLIVGLAVWLCGVTISIDYLHSLLNPRQGYKGHEPDPRPPQENRKGSYESEEMNISNIPHPYQIRKK